MTQNLFDPQTNAAIVARLGGLNEDSRPAWGVMNTAQMLAHCTRPIQVAVGERTITGNFFMRLIGRMVKKSVLGPTPFKINLPTNRAFIVADPRTFAQERSELQRLIERFAKEGASCLSSARHPFFGRLSPNEWGLLMWKHVDHHLRQFGV